MSKKIGKFLVRNFWLLMALGLLIRLILAGISAWNNDIRVWYQFAADLKSGVGVYTNKTFSYPPGLALILGIIYLPLTIFSGPDLWGKFSVVVDKLSVQSGLFHPIITSPFFNYYTKIPLFLAEIALMYILYLTYRTEFSTYKMKILALVFYLNPLVIFINAIHAQLDIFVVLALAASILFFKKNHFLWAGLLLGLATTMKLYPGFLFLAYLYLVFVQTSGRTRRVYQALIFSSAFIAPIIVMAAFMIYQPSSVVSTFARVNTIGFEGSLNLAFINYIPPLVPFISRNSALLALIMQYGLYAVPIFGLLLLPITIKKLPDLRTYLLEFVSLIIIFLIFLLSSRTNPNYLIWALPFLLALAAAEVVSIANIFSISLAALLFYFGIHSLSIKVLFLPLAYFGYPVQSIANQYYRMLAINGLINAKIYADVFLVSAIWFITSQFSIIYRAVTFSRFYYRDNYDEDNDN